MTDVMLHECNSIKEALEKIEDRARGYSIKDLWSASIVAIAIGLVFLLLTCAVACAQDLTASFYSVGSLKRDGQWNITKGVCADGSIFRNDFFTCATRDYPLHRRILVRNKANGKEISVLVTDRINKRFKGKRIDLSKKAFESIMGKQGFNEGLLRVEIEAMK